MKIVLPLLSLCFLFSCSGSKDSNSISQTPEPLLIAYYAGDEVSIDEFDLTGVDQIIFSFMHLKGNRLAIDDAADSLALLQLIAQKEQYPNLKVLVSLGGWGGCETCSDVFATEDGREEFAQSSAEIIEFYDADGIDLDWEYPGISGYPDHTFRPEDKQNFTDVVVRLRNYLEEDAVLSFAAGASSRFIEHSVEWDKVMPLVDHVNLMTYDFYGAGSDSTGHHTALGTEDFGGRSAIRTIEELLQKGVRLDQMVLGAAFYIKTFKNVPNVNHGLYQPAEWNRSYNQVNFEEVAQNFEFYWDDNADAPYAYDSTNQIFATFDDAGSIELKSKYVREKGLKGIMFWQLMNDKKSDGLLSEMVQSIKSN